MKALLLILMAAAAQAAQLEAPPAPMAVKGVTPLGWAPYFQSNPGLVTAIGLSPAALPALVAVMENGRIRLPGGEASPAAQAPVEWMRQRIRLQIMMNSSGVAGQPPATLEGLQKRAEHLANLRVLATVVAPEQEHKIVSLQDDVDARIHAARAEIERKALAPIQGKGWETRETPEDPNAVSARQSAPDLRPSGLTKPFNEEDPLPEGPFTLPPLVALDYRAESWSYDRIVLEPFSNSLPAGSGGTRVDVAVMQEGKWMDFRKADRSKPVSAVAIVDDGTGYAVEQLGVMHSKNKRNKKAVGQFGEGTKLAAATAVRLGVSMRYESRDWTAKAESTKRNLDGEMVPMLRFRGVKGAGRKTINGSRAIFEAPPARLVEEVFNLTENALYFNRAHRVLATGQENAEYPGYVSRALEMTDGKAPRLFVKGIIFKGSRESSILTYDFGTDDISPDRKIIDPKAYQLEVDRLLKGGAPGVVDAVLDAGQRNPAATHVEFTAFGASRDWKEKSMAPKPQPDMADPWVAGFYRKFGEKAVLASKDSNENNDAKLMGMTVVELPQKIREHLERHGVTKASTVATSTPNIAWVDPADLTAAEAAFLAAAEKINAIVLDAPLAFPVDVKIFSGVFLKSGRAADDDIASNTGKAGTLDGRKFIAVRRTKLANWEDFLETYIHELGHIATGKGDFDRVFVRFAYRAAAKLFAAGFAAPQPDDAKNGR
jgi:hypothetical protein